ncbi:MAG: serine/threonine protein kinase [Candidatus Melainabacteria bacterium]|nr:serine/threonine protein kinase [Candidatus Melainabacteria bacterium]
MSKNPFGLGNTVAGPESREYFTCTRRFQPEYLDYCPNAEVSIWFRLIDKWLPAFFILFGLVFLIGIPTNTLDPTLIFLAKTFLVPLKPFLNMASTDSVSGFIQTFSLISQPLFILLGLWLAKLTLDQRSNPNTILLGASGIEIMLKRETFSSEVGAQWVSKKFIDWNHITRVQLVRPKKKRSNLDYLVILYAGSSPSVQIRYGDILSPWHRMKFIEGLNRNLPENVSCEELKDVFGSPNIRQSYTEVWLRELAAAPKRDKLTPLAPGLHLQDGAYTVQEKIGMGGQGTVYLARSQKLPDDSNLVALKEFMLPVFPDPKVRMKAAERFQVEAEMLARLQHPQIVRFFDLFIEDHRAYLVMERVQGANLKALVQKAGRLSEREVARLAWQMCGILKFLHSNDPPITHRDFTPDNLILNDEGMLKVIDFSVARQVETKVTGSVVGKPSYMAPEQFRGRPIPQSDLYSLGATMFYLLTGEEPQAIQTANLGSAFSRKMNDIVSRATAIDADDRFASAEALAAELDTFLAENIDQVENLEGEVIHLSKEKQVDQS